MLKSSPKSQIEVYTNRCIQDRKDQILHSTSILSVIFV